LLAAAFVSTPAAGVIHQDAAHAPGSGGEEVSTILPIGISLLGQFQVNLMDESCSLQSVARAFAAKVSNRDAMQFAVDERHQVRLGLFVSLRDPVQ
jgi:hypothetical protein